MMYRNICLNLLEVDEHSGISPVNIFILKTDYRVKKNIEKYFKNQLFINFNMENLNLKKRMKIEMMKTNF